MRITRRIKATGKTKKTRKIKSRQDFEVETETRPRTEEICLNACHELRQILKDYIDDTY